jgi:hypothetical protein
MCNKCPKCGSIEIDHEMECECVVICSCKECGYEWLHDDED